MANLVNLGLKACCKGWGQLFVSNSCMPLSRERTPEARDVAQLNEVRGGERG